jgi:DNA-binding transcriptional LysR family regulator
MRLRDLKYIKLICEHRNFTVAASYAGVSQPALSAAIARLEDQMGVQLFYRDHQQVRPSFLADYIAARAGRISNELEDIDRHISMIKNKESGDVYFGVGNIIADTFLFDALSDFCASHEQITPRFTLGYWYDLRKRLLDGDISFFITGNHQNVKDEEVDQIDFIDLDIIFVAAPDHPLFDKKITTCRDIAYFPVITYQTVVAKRLIRERLSNEEDIRNFEMNFPAGLLESISLALPLVKNSRFILMGPRDLFVNEFASGELRELKIAEFELTLNVKIVTRQKYILSPAEKDMISSLELARDKCLARRSGDWEWPRLEQV